MELGELRVFVTVATERSFSRAAIKLCRTQPAVSQAVRRLEADLGELLFIPSARALHETMVKTMRRDPLFLVDEKARPEVSSRLKSN